MQDVKAEGLAGFMEGRSKKQKADGEKGKVSEGDAAVRDALVDVLRGAGIDVVTDEAEGQRVLDEAVGGGISVNQAKKRALETLLNLWIVCVNWRSVSLKSVYALIKK